MYLFVVAADISSEYGKLIYNFLFRPSIHLIVDNQRCQEGAGEKLLLDLKV